MFTLRHQGSPQVRDGLTLAQIVEGLQDGLWEPTDEIRGPGEREWRSLEDHPATTEIVAELDRDELCGATGVRSVAALVAWKLGWSLGNAHTIATVARRER